MNPDTFRRSMESWNMFLNLERCSKRVRVIQESDEDDDRLWILITIEDDDSTNVDVFNRKESVREHLINSDNFDDEDIDEIMTNGKVDVGWCRVELWHCPIED